MVSFKSLFASRKHRVALISGALIIVLVVGTYAYLQSLPSTSGPRVYVKSSVAEFYLELDKSEYQFGENITITFYVNNTSNKTIEIFKPSIDEGFQPPDDKYLSTDIYGVSGSRGLAPPILLSLRFHNRICQRYELRQTLVGRTPNVI